VTVVSDRTAEADGLATALLVMGPDLGMRYATDAGIAAYFLQRVGDDVEERTTTAFDALLE
jgi:thiamine biosynthesis lipoprotein